MTSGFITEPGAGAATGRGAVAEANVSSENKIRVLIGKPGLDGHDRGAKIVARALRDAGMEVIYTGLHQTPEMIVSAAVQEDVQAIGLSVLSGAHLPLFQRVRDLMVEQKCADMLLFGGGIIPEEDAAELTRIGVDRVFTPGATTAEIVDYLRTTLAVDGGASS